MKKFTPERNEEAVDITTESAVPTESFKQPQQPLNTKQTVEMLRRKVNAQTDTIDQIRIAMNKAVDVIQRFATEQNEIKTMLRAHVLHVRELHNNPLFLQSLVQKLEDLADEGEAVANMKLSGNWVNRELVPHETLDTIPEDSVAFRITMGGSAEEPEVQIEQPDGHGNWMQALPFVLTHNELSREKAMSYLPDATIGSVVYLQVIPGHFKDEAAETLQIKLDESAAYGFIDTVGAYTIGGESEVDSVHIQLAFTELPLPASEIDRSLSYRVERMPEGVLLTQAYYDGDKLELPYEAIDMINDDYVHAMLATRDIVYIAILPASLDDLSEVKLVESADCETSGPTPFLIYE